MLVLQVQLSTYGDSLGKNLKDLKQFIDNNLQGIAPDACDTGHAPALPCATLQGTYCSQLA